MFATVSSTADGLPSDKPTVLSTEQKLAINFIWDLLNASNILRSSEPWPGLSAVQLREYIIPENDPTAGPMPLALAHFLKKDLRNMQIDHRTDRLGMNMVE